VELFKVILYNFLYFGYFTFVLLLTNQYHVSGDIQLRNIQDPQVSIYTELCMELLPEMSGLAFHRVT
jgi:hypothetical protein